MTNRNLSFHRVLPSDFVVLVAVAEDKKVQSVIRSFHINSEETQKPTNEEIMCFVRTNVSMSLGLNLRSLSQNIVRSPIYFELYIN